MLCSQVDYYVHLQWQITCNASPQNLNVNPCNELKDFLMAHNWQKWRSRFLTCPCHEIYEVEAVGQYRSNYTFKNYDFCEYVKFGVILWKFDILSITTLNFKSKNPFARTCDTYNCDYLQHTTFCFYLIDFQLNTDFPSQFCVFTIKSPSVTQRSVSQENVFKKSKNLSPFFSARL